MGKKETTKGKKPAKVENVEESDEADEVKEFENENDGYDSDITLVGDKPEGSTADEGMDMFPAVLDILGTAQCAVKIFGKFCETLANF